MAEVSTTQAPTLFKLAEAFPSEALLQQAIAGLLTRMPDITGVQILQGAQELGKDIIFYIRGGFEEPVLCACVVKNTKITGDVTRPTGARAVWFQAQQAFDSNHTDGTGKEVPVERVYIVTPYDLAPATILSIKGQLQERAGQIVFIGGPALFDLFKKYWPDYFADEATAIDNHMRQTKQLIETASPLDELAAQYNLGQTRTYDKKVYVSQALYRELSNYQFGKVITDSLPDSRTINGQILPEEVKTIEDRINLFQRFTISLNEWNFCSDANKDDFVSQSNHFTLTLNNLLGEIEKEQRKAAKEEEARKPFSTTRPAVEEKIDYALQAKQQLKDLTVLRDRITKPIKQHVAELNRILSKQTFDGVESLSDSFFLAACIVDDFARSSREGVFERQDGVRIEFPKQILSMWDNHLMIVGAPGFGKTSFCRWHALHDAEEFTAGRSNVIPVYVPLSHFSSTPIGSFEDAFLRSLGKSALIGQISEKNSAKVRIYLDGLDEVAASDRREQLVELAKSGVAGSDHFQIILTSRDYIYGRWLDWFPRIALGGLEKPDINELIDKWLGNTSESNERFRQELNNLPILENLMRTPLLATLVIMVFRQTGKLPESRTRLYEIFTNLLSGGWDLAKGVLRESKFDERTKLMVLSNLAGSLHERRRTQFAGEEVKNAVRAVLPGRVMHRWDLLQEEFVVDGLVSRSGEVMQFSHLSFQEFLAAKDFMGMPQPLRINRALESFLWGDGWWKESIKFYIGLSSNPGEIRKWLISRIKQFDVSAAAEVSVSQVQELLSAISEAFPGYPKTSQREAERVLRMTKH